MSLIPLNVWTVTQVRDKSNGAIGYMDTLEDGNIMLYEFDDNRRDATTTQAEFDAQFEVVDTWEEAFLYVSNE